MKRLTSNLPHLGYMRMLWMLMSRCSTRHSATSVRCTFHGVIHIINENLDSPTHLQEHHKRPSEDR